MKVYVYPADRAGCGYYRLIWAAEVLRARGHDVVTVMPHERGGFLNGELDDRGNIVNVQLPADADVVVFQRISHRHLAAGVPIIRKKGVAVVIDVDDDLAAIHPANPAAAAFQGLTHPDHHWQNVVRACADATLVTVSTRALAPRYAAHGRVAVIDNYVPERYLAVPHEDSVVVGWGGSVRSHPNDLQVVGSAIARLTREGIVFRVVGPGDHVAEYLTIPGDVDATGTLAIENEWPRGLAQLGIGIAPLADTRFNEAKSRLKMLELAALGVPCVASPSAEYTRLNRLGIGLLARKPSAWHKHLRNLTRDASLRRELSELGREVAATLTIEANSHVWWDAWTRAYENEQTGPLPALRRASNLRDVRATVTNG